MITIEKIKSSVIYNKITKKGYKIYFDKQDGIILVKTELKHPTFGVFSSTINEIHTELEEDIIDYVLERQMNAIETYINNQLNIKK